MLDQLADPDTVEFIHAYATALGKRLGAAPSRSAFGRFRKQYIEDQPDLADQLDDAERDAAVRQGIGMGLFPTSGRGSITRPSLDFCFAADGTWIPSRFKRGESRTVTRLNGEITYLVDEGAQEMPGNKDHGQLWVSQLGRTSETIDGEIVTHKLERVIFDARPARSGHEGETLLEIVERMRPLLQVRPMQIYDMGIYPETIDRLLRLQVNVAVKVPRIAKQGVAYGTLGRRVLKCADGDQSAVVDYLDGCPGLTRVADTDKWFVRFSLRQTKWNEQGECYAWYDVPDHPLVEPELRGTSFWYRLTATDEERGRGFYPTSRIRPLPESDPHFDEIFGLREDTESMHRNKKDCLFEGRARSVGLDKQRYDMSGYRSRSNLRAALAFERRTGTMLDDVLLPEPGSARATGPPIAA